MYGKETDIPDPDSIFLSWGKPENQINPSQECFSSKVKRGLNKYPRFGFHV